MKHRIVFSSLLLLALFLALSPTALASNTWYVDGSAVQISSREQ